MNYADVTVWLESLCKKHTNIPRMPLHFVRELQTIEDIFHMCKSAFKNVQRRKGEKETKKWTRHDLHIQ